MSPPSQWRVRLAPWVSTLAVDPQRLASQLLAAIEAPVRVLRDDRRSRVIVLDKLTDLAELRSPAGSLPLGPWVLKRPRWRDERLWNRLSSWFGEGEMNRAFSSALLLLELGVATPRPLLVMERRCLGILLESWLAYEFLEGHAVQESDWPAIVEVLCRMHAAGLAHRDPHLANWLALPMGGVAVLDPGSRQLRPGHADDAYDFILLRNCRPEILPLLPLQGSWKWRMAEARNAWVQGWRSMKRRVRGPSVLSM